MSKFNDIKKLGKKIIKDENLLNKVFVYENSKEKKTCVVSKDEESLMFFVVDKINAYVEGNMLQQFDEETIAAHKSEADKVKSVMASIKSNENYVENDDSGENPVNSIYNSIKKEYNKLLDNIDVFVECNNIKGAVEEFCKTGDLELGVGVLFKLTIPQMYDIVGVVDEEE